MKQLDRALLYAAKGFSVIPVGANKIPLIGWKEFQSRRATPEEILAWWKKTPDAQVGIVTGQISDLTVIDVEATGDSSPMKDDTFTVKTGGNGIHFYFKYDKDFTNMVRARPLVDVRSEGGYVVAPGARSHKGEYKAIGDEHEMKVARMSPETKEWLLGAKQSVTPYTTAGTGPSTIPYRLELSYGMAQGGRNDAIHKDALKLLAKMDEQSAWNTIVGINASYKPPLPESEVRTAFNSALRRFRESPPVNPHTGQPARSQQQQKKPLEENHGFRITRSSEDVQRALTIYKEGRTQGIPTGFEPLDSITGGLIPGQLYLVYADTNVGKSLFAVNMLWDLVKRGVRCLYFDLENSFDMTVERLILVANGGNVKLFDWRKAQEDRNAVYLDEAAKVLSPHIDNMYIWDITKLNDRFGDISWDAIKKCILEGVRDHAQIIVLDHLHFFSPAETDHGRLGEIAREISIMAAEHNIAFVVVAHTRKGLVHTTKDDKVKVYRPTIDYVMGSKLIVGHFKNVIALRRNVAATDITERQLTTVYVDKTKFGPASQFELTYDEQCLIFRDPNMFGGTVSAEEVKEARKANQEALDAFDRM